MSLVLAFKALLGALVVILIAALSRTKNYYIAGLVPLFPTFTLIAHYIVGSTRTHAELKTTIFFSIYGLLPLLLYLIAVYILIDRLKLEWALFSAAMIWCIVAGVMLCWMKMKVEL